MTGTLLTDQLAGRGLAAGECAAKRLLFGSVLQAFQRVANGAPTHAWWVPGRLELFGRHTDYAGGHSLVCAVPRGFAFAARARTDGVVRLLDARRGEDVSLDGLGRPPQGAAHSPGAPEGDGSLPPEGDGSLPPEGGGSLPPEGGSHGGSRGEGRTGSPAVTGWRNYAEVVVRRLSRNFPGAPLGADIVFASDLPSASGMSSSSALLVGLAAALVRLARLDERAEWTGNVHSPAGEAGYYACIENGMTFGTLAGDAGVGTHGGSEDHAAILCGSPNELSAWRFVPIAHVRNVPLPSDWTLAIATSGVAAKKTGPAKHAYNRLSREAGALLDIWNRAASPAPSLGAALRSHASAGERLAELVTQSVAAGSAARALGRRLSHFVREDARVLEAVEAVGHGDRGRLTALAEASQADAEALLDNQVPETAALVRSARALGAVAASSFGAGFGGSVWAIVEPDAAASRFARRWLADYRAKFSDRSAATAFAARPGPPLTRVG